MRQSPGPNRARTLVACGKWAGSDILLGMILQPRFFQGVPYETRKLLCHDHRLLRLMCVFRRVEPAPRDDEWVGADGRVDTYDPE